MDNSEPAIRVTDLHKDFLLPSHRNTTLKQAFVSLAKKNEKIMQHVLNGVSFEVKKGEFFGIVGRNGSGKSTLLKILAGVYFPTSGKVDINGELTPFIELGVGFNPELSGRDNVFLNGALLGFSRKEMAAMYDEIVAFAELEEHMDKKLKNYSSGMQVRLAFSIAVKAKNDILIFDEVLAVGDEAFQQKCLDVFMEYKNNPSQTVILVTHGMEQVEKFCTRALLLDGGKIKHIGDPKVVAKKYRLLNEPTSTNSAHEGLGGSEGEPGKQQRNLANHMIQDFQISAKEYGLKDEIVATIVMKPGVNLPKTVVAGINIYKIKDPYNACHVEYNSFTALGEYDLTKQTTFTVRLQKDQLYKGEYIIKPHLLDVADTYKIYFPDDLYREFTITEANKSKSGSFNLTGTWEAK